MLYDVLISIFWKARIQILRAEIRTEIDGRCTESGHERRLVICSDREFDAPLYLLFLSQILIHKDYTIIIFTASCRL